ncbi:MAG: helix-turn-helix domain-containing protein [Bdellovibrionales bacterium]|nr:helix-turn-helix domain-containing protein [Bdellovibrionales bacterium]
MEFNQESSHYELLDIAPDASPQEIRAAYMRARAAFQKDSLAIYSLMDSSEANEMIQKIETAYQILSHPERKREYDRSFLSRPNPTQAATLLDNPFESSSPIENIISIDRTPPMESSLDEQLLVAPALPETKIAENQIPEQKTIELEEWSGPQIKKARERLEYPIERLMEATRIRRSYLLAIEGEDFAKLPATVFVRGFLTQIARELKLPADGLIRSYLKRLEDWKVSQSSDSR